MLRRIATGTVAVGCLASLSQAQGQGTAAVSGAVRLKGDSTVPLAGVAVLFDTALARATDGSGKFLVAGLSPGEHRLTFRRVGLYPATQKVSLRPGDTAVVVIEMERVGQRLAEVRIAGRSVFVPTRYADAYRRAATGSGDFIFRDEIERRNPWDTKSLLQGIPGVFVNDRTVAFLRCPDTRYVHVYVNGVRASRFEDANETLKTIHPLDIEIMEIYRGVARIPAEFLDDACAVIAIWTR